MNDLIRRPRVFTDVDGVLADDAPSIIEAINQVGKLDLKSEDFESWDFFAHSKVKPIADEVWKTLEKKGRIRNLPLLPGSVEAIAELQKFCDVFCLTSSVKSEFYHYERQLWLEEHFGFDRKKVIFNHAKYTERGDMLIDDRPENIESWVGENPSGIGVLRRTVQNRKYVPAHKRIVVATSWTIVILLAKSLAKMEIKS